MAHYGTLRDVSFTGDVDDIRGATLYGINDEKLGKIDDVIFDHASGTIRYVVVDAGGWLSSKQFLVAADRIQPDAEHKNDFYARMTKQQIESLPRFDEARFSEDPEQNERDWSDYNQRYRESLETTGDVLHREDSTHVITPGPDELPATGPSLPNEDALQPGRLSGVFTNPAPGASKTRMRPSGIAARAEDSALPGQSVPEEIPTEVGEQALDRSSTNRLSAFEEHLRHNRQGITANCPKCRITGDKAA